MVEVLDGDSRLRGLPDVVAVTELADLVEDPLRLLGGDLAVALRIGEELPELIGVHVRLTVGEGGEGGFHVGRRLRLVPPELASEAHAVLVAPHLAENSLRTFSFCKLAPGFDPVGGRATAAASATATAVIGFRLRSCSVFISLLESTVYWSYSDKYKKRFCVYSLVFLKIAFVA